MPGICYYGAINHVLIDTMRKWPGMFGDGYKIGSVYGTFPGAIWNGGRTILDGLAKNRKLKKLSDHTINSEFL